MTKQDPFHSLLPAALIAIDSHLGETVESFDVTVVNEPTRTLFLQNVNRNYTIYDEESDTYFNYSLNAQAGEASELYDLNAQRRMIQLTPVADDRIEVLDTVSQLTVQIKLLQPGEALLEDDADVGAAKSAHIVESDLRLGGEG